MIANTVGCGGSGYLAGGLLFSWRGSGSVECSERQGASAHDQTTSSLSKKVVACLSQSRQPEWLVFHSRPLHLYSSSQSMHHHAALVVLLKIHTRIIVLSCPVSSPIPRPKGKPTSQSHEAAPAPFASSHPPRALRTTSTTKQQ